MSAIQPETADTLPKLLLAQAARWGDRRVAIREKEFGIWQSHSWQGAARHVERIALGLASLGLRRGDKIAVIGDNRPQLYWSMLAAQALGGAPVPVYQASTACRSSGCASPPSTRDSGRRRSARAARAISPSSTTPPGPRASPRA